MKTLYLDCSMGAAGDMLSSALLELFDDPQEMVGRLNALGVPGVRYTLENSVKCGITGSHLRVLVNGSEEHEHHHDHEYDHEHHHDCDHEHEHHHEDDRHHEHHHHSGVENVRHIIADHLDLPDAVRDDALAVFGLLAEAESHVHGVPVSEIHFHEVGTMDAVADVVSFCTLIDAFGGCEILASPVCTGSGFVRCAHGTLPVPAPATAYLLRDIPIYSGEIRAELCTPTGAALLRYFVKRFGPMPVMRVGTIGYGMGTKDFDAANCVRAMLGETDDDTDRAVEFACNLDDMTGEAIGYAVRKLFEAGALDVWTIPAYMKKNRPGTVLHALCAPSDKDAILQAIFKHTTTIGVRENNLKRYTMRRETETIETDYGTVRYKISDGYGAHRDKIEADDLQRIADEQGCSLDEAMRLLGD